MLRAIGCLHQARSPHKILRDGLGIHLQREEPWEGLGSCLKVSEGNPNPFVLFFNSPFAPRSALSGGGQREMGLWGELGTAGRLQGRNLGQGPLRRRRSWLCPRSPALASAPPGARPALGVWDTGLCFGE